MSSFRKKTFLQKNIFYIFGRPPSQPASQPARARSCPARPVRSGPGRSGRGCRDGAGPGFPVISSWLFLFFPRAGRARGGAGPLPAGPDCLMSPIKMAEKAAAAASKPQGHPEKSSLSRKNRGGRRRSTPGEAGISIKFAFLAPGAGRVPESMQKPPFSTPYLAPRFARDSCPLLTSCARRGLAQDLKKSAARSARRFLVCSF